MTNNRESLLPYRWPIDSSYSSSFHYLVIKRYKPLTFVLLSQLGHFDLLKLLALVERISILLIVFWLVEATNGCKNLNFCLLTTHVIGWKDYKFWGIVLYFSLLCYKKYALANCALWSYWIWTLWSFNLLRNEFFGKNNWIICYFHVFQNLKN